jgi:O-antigen/teichoic acid export membrane protein
MASSTEPSPGRAADPLAAGPAGAQFLRGGALRVLGYGGGILTSIVALPFMTRHLHRADYGRYVVVTSLILIVTVLSEGGIGSLGVREFEGAPRPARHEFMRNLIGIRITLSTLGGIGAIVFALLAGYPRVVVEGTVIAAFGLILAGVQVTLTVPLTAALRLQWLAGLDFLVPAVTAAGLIVLVVLGAPLLAFFAAAVLAYAVSLIVTSALVHNEVTLRPAFDLARWRSLLRDSAVFAAATAFGVVYFQVVVVAMSLISTPQATGTFSLAFRVLSVVNGIPVLLVGSAFPILLRAARDDRERLRYASTRLLEGNLLLGGWLSLLLVAGAPFAIHAIGGPGFAGSAGVLRILGTGVIATFVAAVFAMTLLSLRAYRLLICTSLSMVALAVLLCAVLIPGHGARGAAVVTITLEVVLACAYGAMLSLRNPELRPALGRTGRICAALAIGFAAALAVPVSSVPAALIGTAALAVSAVALHAVPVELFAALRPRQR